MESLPVTFAYPKAFFSILPASASTLQHRRSCICVYTVLRVILHLVPVVAHGITLNVLVSAALSLVCCCGLLNGLVANLCKYVYSELLHH